MCADLITCARGLRAQLAGRTARHGLDEAARHGVDRSGSRRRGLGAHHNTELRRCNNSATSPTFFPRTPLYLCLSGARPTVVSMRQQPERLGAATKWPRCQIAECSGMLAHARRFLRGIAVALGTAWAAGADAASLQWDANGATPGSGGTGTWNTTTALWFNGSSFQNWNNAALDDAVFGG